MISKTTFILLFLTFVCVYSQIACTKMACPPVNRLHCNLNNGQFIKRNIETYPGHCCDFCLYRGEIGEPCNGTSTIDKESRGYVASCQDQYAVCHMNTHKCGPYVN